MWEAPSVSCSATLSRRSRWRSSVITVEVEPNSRLVWTNEESDDGAITTVTFKERGGETVVVIHDLYPSKEALDAAIASGSTSGTGETFAQLDELLVTLGAGVGRS